jgi:hypothetical protein
MGYGNGPRRRHPASQAGPLIALLLALAPGLAAASPGVFRYGRFEQAFTSSRDYANPLAEEVRVEFTGPEGMRRETLAFWDGGRTWRVRFSPERAGAWRFRVTPPDPSDGGLKRSGEFRVSPYKGPNSLSSRGGPRLSADRRHFVHADGTPWFWLGDTAWNGALRSTDDEWEKYLSDRGAKRFTAIQFVMTQWRAGRQDERGQVAFTGVDPVRVNPAFFRRMDKKLEAVNDRGLVGVPVLLWALTSRDNESPGELLSDIEAARLARYMVARYDAFHVLWLLGGDGDYGGERASRWKAIGRTVFPPERGRRPVSMHPRGMQSPWADYRDEPWVDYFMYQSGHGNNPKKWRWNATAGGAIDWRIEPARPVIDGEINYEGHLDYHTGQPVSDSQVRRAAWYSLLAAPPAGFTYGAHGIWWWGRKAEVPLDHPRTGTALPWFECLDYPGARQMKVLRDVLDGIEWWQLRPDRSLLAEDPEDTEFASHIMPARAENGGFALLYLPGNASVKLDQGSIRGYTGAVWIDPGTGQRHTAKLLPVMQPPGPGDWLLLCSGRNRPVR